MKVVLFGFLAILSATASPFELKKGSRVVLLGNGLGSRMMQFGSFETLLHLQHPERNLFIRNMCDEGNTPGFRPHSARSNPWAFPGAEKFHPALSKAKDRWGSGHTGNGSIPTPDEWLTQLKLLNGPAQFRDETSKYTDPLPDRSARQFTFPMETKSLITSPSGEMTLPRAGIYKITGLAWSGSGSIRGVEVSADGGRTWADALLESEQWDKALTRFSIPWEWNGGDAILQSRAIDSAGNVQLTREAVIADRGTDAFYHNPGIQSWAVSSQGDVSSVAV